MSYFSQLKNGQITAKEFITRGLRLVYSRFGVSVSDAKIDAGAKALDDLTDVVEKAVSAYVMAHAPGVPAAIAVAATNAALNVVDAAIAGAAEAAKKAND